MICHFWQWQPEFTSDECCPFGREEQTTACDDTIAYIEIDVLSDQQSVQIQPRMLNISQ